MQPVNDQRRADGDADSLQDGPVKVQVRARAVEEQLARELRRHGKHDRHGKTGDANKDGDIEQARPQHIDLDDVPHEPDAGDRLERFRSRIDQRDRP